VVKLTVTKTIEISGKIPNVVSILNNFPTFDYKIVKHEDGLILTVTFLTEGFFVELLRRLKDKKNRKGTVVKITESSGGDDG
jgi:hypothetical protein